MKVLVLQVNRFDEVEDFLEAEKLLPAIMHTLCLIWAHCKYFTSSSKLINILSLICNMLITKARKYINPSKIFQIELEETAPAIVKTIHVLNNFKKLFDFCRQNLYSYFPKGEKSVPWLFDKEAVFKRFNIFIHRMQKLEALFSTAIEYSKLEKIELGGILGRYLSGKVSKMHTEFQLIIRQFQQVTYDPTDIDDESFVKDYANFTERVVDIDRRLASILNQAVMDCHNLQQFLKLIYVVGSLLERPIIHKEVSPKCERVIDMLSEELDACSDIFNEQMDSFLSTGQMQVDLNWPPIAGRLQWIIKLRSRLQTSISKYKEWDSQIVKLEESSDALKKYDIMMGKLDQLEDETISKWVAEISNTISQNLSKTLFAIHADTKLLSINYSCELIAAVREIRYLLLLETYSIPDLAIQFYSKNNEFILLIFTLDQIIQWYNLLRESSRPEEFNLIEHQIKEIDTIIDYSQEVLTWNSQDAHLTIEKIKTLVYRLYLRVSKAQRNIKEIIRLSSQWNSRPLYCRKNNKKDALLSLENRGEKLQKRYHEIRKASSEIYKLTKENFYLYFKGGTENVGENDDTIGNLESPSNKVVDEKKFSFDEDDLLSNKKKRNLESQNHHETNNSDSSSPESAQGFEWSEVDDDAESRQKWDNYIHYVDSIVLEGLIKAVNCSIGYLEEQMVCSSEKAPLMEISLELTEPLITFQPSLDLQDPEGLFCLVVNLIDEIQAMSEYAHQISTQKQGQSFREDIEGNDDISFFISSILSETENVINEAVKFANTFEQYNYLWLGDRFEYLNQFLKYGKPLTAEEEEMIGKSDEDGQIIIKESSPRLDDYKAQIDMYEEIYKEVDQIPSSKVFFNWFRVDIRPFKQALLNNICKWSMLFKRHLMDYVVYNLADLADFINKSDVNLNHGFLLQEGDYDGLVHVMGCLLKVKERQIMTDIMFTPFQEIIEFLKNYDLDFPEEIFVQLQDLPDQWINTKKLALSVKAAISPLVQREANTIKKRIILFDIRQMLYKELFKDYEFFNWTCKEPYAEIDNIHLEIKNLEEMTCRLSEQAVLFEVSCPEFKFVPVVRKELKLLKILWDYIIIIRSWFRDWEDTHWTKIDSEAMDMELKKFSKELRSLDKDMRNWEIYLQLEAMIKNMITALKAVAELQNPAIRERHWQQLMAATKVKFMIDESTTLADLLALHLYKYEEEVKTIVDKSVKEQSMEKILNELKQIWGMMEFTYEINERTNCWLLKCSEDTIEILEEHQVQLQNMMSSKFVEYFQQEVSEWQRKLGKVDQVVNLWLEVQRTWIHLESIFIGSEDIRRQLPHDSARFDATDQEFKTMLCDIHKIPNMVNACNRPNLVETLEKVQLELTKCEKALAQYLESKRCIYPRFYFISSADLLDILSNSDNPEAVCRHLTKLYDSIAKIKFREDSDPRKRKIAKGMFAKDGEYVEFSEDCDCNGQVEKWLNNVTDVMRKTGRHYFAEAVLTYDEKPREQWIFDYPAQSALCGTQIWWTTEVELAFARLEEGYENALKDYNKKQIIQLNTLISLLLGDLTTGDRQKIMTICTIDVHARDVICKLVNARVESSAAFQWQSQLRHRWDKVEWDCFANICDAEFRYDYEYLGNTPRLVTTPLTDRCYITLSQSLHLIMGGAPAGPAGTGKTETTKDLGKAIGIMVYVFNCSEQMDYKSVGNIYKGLAQTGAWGCFDEFNRISVEVLSVVAVQVKTVLDAIKGKKSIFNFLGETIKLVPTVGMFITMNPGYAGRAELPENLKALFRPCAMVVPDFELICEIMLVAEGFQEARMLARKFITLYSLCKELLSNQDHYDWGLRAIKSVLVVAGSLKRGDRMRPEEQVLMRALRDFNIPKIVTDDMPIFMGLISDLFPSLEIPRMKDLDFEKQVRNAALSLKLQPEDSFILKVVQLVELFAVRHSVFIIGSAGTGKSEVWKTLFKTYQNMKLKPHYNDLEPKAVTNDELFGIINPATREWKDGLFSVLLRDQALMTGDGPKWMVMDGDIDPMWIESLNTVMDDNKVLTLASNERIALTPEMRLLFEISNLKTATPATVSRAGILYINPQDLGWNPYMTSWLENRRDDTEKGTVLILFDKYVPPVLEMLRTKCKQITPIPEITHVQMLCSLLDALLVPSNVPSDSPKEWYETYFVFACVWAFGSACFQDQLIDWRAEFSKWWVNEFKAIKFPPAGSVFNYYIDPETKKFVPWAEKVDKFELDPEIPLQASLVPTAETVRLKFFLNLFIQMRKPVMLVGPGGSGKSIIVNEKLSCLSESFAHLNVPLNFYTTSEMLQKVLEKSLEKKAGRNYGPPGNKFMIYFIDDLNMPEVDQHGTVQPHTLIRQWMNYQHWYDRSKLTLKDIHNIMFLACMNPSAGSFTIDSRLQRHFFVFATNFPCAEELHYIYSSVLNQHLNNHHLKFPVSVIRHGDLIIQLALMMHAKMATTFLPTAIKFHYTFNLRDLTNVFQGIMFANGDCVPTPGMFVRLWMHETCRVYGDKLVDTRDQDNFNKLLVENIKKVFQELPESEYLEKPLIYCHFVEGLGDPKYMPVTNWSHLNKLLTDAMAQYNDLVSAMNLVLFEDAMSHICRINRIMESPRGNVLLVGVGGSGKQSLARLSAFISGLESFQIQLKKGYNISDMKIDLANLYLKTGLKNVGIMLLMTDSQIIDEKFLVLINDMLASGEILDLFSDEEVDHIISAIKPEVKGTGLVDSREMCWKFFIDRVRKLLKIILCFSPVGPSLRIRARRFPAIVNCTSINWFYEWPQEALESVSKRFLSEIEELPGNLVVSASSFMAFVHTSVNKVSVSYFQNEKRFNYTTPKSFLEQILLYRKLLKSSTIKINDGIQRFQTGLQKLLNCALQVDGLQKELAVKEIELMEKNSKAEELIKVVGKEQLKVADEKQFVAEEERKVRIIEEDVSMKQRCCEEDLERAEPALVAAQAALDTLNKNNLTELKSFGSPPPAVANVTAGVMVLFAAKGKLPKDRSWKACKLMMAKLDAFLDALLHYDKENVHPDVVKGIQPYLKDPEFDPDAVRSKSTAAAGLCAWVINIMKFHDVWVVVEPKRRALVAANSELAAARNKLAELKLRISALEAKLQDLTNKFETAVNEKLVCQAQADECSEKIDLANRLVNGLASENVRWRESVTTFQMNAFTLPGDVLLVTAFISYVGCFTRPYREKLLNSHWLPFLKKLKPEIPLTNFVEPLNILADSATIASWNNEGLPNDRMSAENAVIVVNSEKWPLLIDPQLQGIKWIKNKYGERLSVVRLGHDQTMDILEECLRDGRPLLIENIGESLDPILSNLIARNLIHRGRAVRVGEKEMVFNPDFRLILHTKLANPHYKPELQAQTTLINFTVTHKGLEEQLLAEVVKAERPDLEESKSGLTKQQNNFKIALKQLEDELLWRLSSAGGEVLSDKNLVLNLEQSKLMAKDIEVQVVEAKLTSAEIDKAREKYRTAATRASIIYFIMSDLYKINPIYQFSLKAFSVVFHKAILTAEPSADIQERVTNLIDNITFMIFMYTCRGLFESDKLIFLAQMTIQILAVADEIKADELDFVLRFPFVTGLTSPVDFLTNQLWGGIKALAMMDDFRGLDKDIEGAAKRWKKFIEGECPERDKLPQEWKGKSSLQRLCIMRSIRPDRMTYAVQCFIEEKLGAKFVEARSVEFEKSFQEASAIIPIFFILSPGVDPTRDVERVGKRMGFTADGRNFHNVSLGQGQEGIAEEALELSAKVGHWLILQNVHLVKNWLPILDKKMEKSFENPHPDYRLFISAEPSPDPEFHVIPQGILESSIKITNEPPTGMLANLHKALDNFNQNTLEMCSKEGEFKAILFSLCYFHACIAERKKFGPQGWNRSYPFNVGDLTISVHVLYNYLEANSKVPWEDLRYLFGEIMYGGHVTDDWDRRLCRTYLEEFMSPHLMEGDKYFAPGFPAPPNTDYIGYHNYIDDMLPQESPTLYGLHPNAEIGFLTMKAEHLFKTLLELQPRESTTSVTGIISREDKVRQVLDEILDKVPDEFNIPDMISKIEDKTPFTVVAVQECERMNLLMREIRRSLKELSLGLKGELSVTGVMESLETALFLDLVPSEWVKLAYPSMLNLGCWFQDLMIRLKELEAWISDFGLPSTIWLSGFFNPQSFLTAIMQTAARKNEWPLDKMCLLCDVTKKTREDFTAPPREGAYVSGLFMEGARWDMATGTIAESRLKELVPAMPVIYVKAVIEDKHEIPNLYECPIYKTRMRGPTYVWTFNLKTREKPAKWILAGVALLLSA